MVNEVLLYYTEVCWLSKEQVLKRLFELRVGVSLFRKKKINLVKQSLESEDFLQGLTYTGFSRSYSSYRGYDVTTVDATERLKDF